jgi:hypothetical protein
MPLRPRPFDSSSAVVFLVNAASPQRGDAEPLADSDTEALNPPSATTAAAVCVFFSLALIADLRPVPMDESGKSEVSIASVFIHLAANVALVAGAISAAQSVFLP